MKQKTILIFGVSGLIGSNLAEALSKDYKVVGTYHSKPVLIPHVLTLPCDVLVKEQVRPIVFTFKPDLAIYCVGLPSVEDGQNNRELTEILHTSGLFNVAESCQRYKSMICHISSAFVFAGEEKKYLEMDIPDPESTYGKSQASSEFYLQKTSINYIIFRTCKLYGRNLNPEKSNWFEILQNKLKARESLPCDDAIKLGFIDVFYLAGLVKICLEKNINNRLLQVSSKDILSHYEFAKTYCEVFKENKDLLHKDSWSFPLMSRKTDESRPYANSCFHLDVGNIEGLLEISFPTIKESLEFTYRRFFGSKKKSALKETPEEKMKFV